MFDFAANQTVDALEVVPEQFRGAYVEKDGAFTISDTYRPFVDLVGGLNTSLAAARKEAKAAKSATVDLSMFADYGSTPGEIHEKVTATITDLQDKLSKGMKIDPEKIKKDLEQGFNQKLAAKDEEIKGMSSSLESYLVNSEATRAIAELKGVPELLLPHLRSQVKVVKTNTGYTTVVVDSDGDARMNMSGGQMTIKDLVAEMKTSPVFGRAFESETPTGSGVRPGSTAKPNRPQVPTQQRSAVDKIRAGLDKAGR